MRALLPVFSVMLLIAIAGPSSLAPVLGLHGGSISLIATPVLLDPNDPGRRRVGALVFRRGWSLTSSSGEFGGLSALRRWGGQWLAVLDIGGLVLFAPGKQTATILPVAPRCSPNRVKLGFDLEGLDTDGRHIWIAAERRNTICRRDPGGNQVGIRPPAMSDWSWNRGPETLLRLHDGRFLVVPEDTSLPTLPTLLFPRDPVSGVAPRRLRYTPPEGYVPTDAAQLPDGRIVILHRKFGMRGFQTRIVMFRGVPNRGSITGRTIATIAAPLIHDNFEGIAARTERGATMITLVSDDNFNWWQRTLLLEFQLDD